LDSDNLPRLPLRSYRVISNYYNSGKAFQVSKFIKVLPINFTGFPEKESFYSTLFIIALRIADVKVSLIYPGK